MSEWAKVTSVEACTPGQMVAGHVAGTDVVVCNVEGDFYALEDLCSHQDLPLSDGELDGSELTCIHHGARFDVCTGRALCLPAIRPLKTIEVEVRDGDVHVRVG